MKPTSAKRAKPLAKKSPTKKKPTPPAKKYAKEADEERAAAASTFSERLRQARRKAGCVTLDDAALCLGVTREGYGRLERGKIMPRADLLLRLARLFDVSADWLLGLKDKP